MTGTERDLVHQATQSLKAKAAQAVDPDPIDVQAAWEQHYIHSAIEARKLLAKLGLYPDVTAADFPLPDGATAEHAREQLRAYIDVLDVADITALCALARLMYSVKAEGFVYDFIAHFAPKYTEARA